MHRKPFAIIFALLMARTSAQNMPMALSSVLANNTSAADTFKGAFNGNAAAGNVSPLPLSSLLPSGTQTKYIAHLVPFFTLCVSSARTCGGHLNVGYEQDSADQVAKQLNDIYRRGFAGVLLDWYGPENKHHDGVALKMMHEAERMQAAGTPLFFAIQPDQGVVRGCSSTECNTQKLIDAIIYANRVYEGSSAYWRWKGRPVIPLFWDDKRVPVDWAEVRAKVPGNPLLVFRNSGAFTHQESDGGFAWADGIKAPPDIGIAYLENFYRAAAKPQIDEQQLVIGAAFAGFDDRLAPWGKQKIAVQNCGLTWLATMKESMHFQEQTGSPLPFLQVVTWNDYEEGTAVEPGIGNCVESVPAKIGNEILHWHVVFGKDKDGFTGSEETIAYYRVLVTEGKGELREIDRIPVSSPHELDLARLHLLAGQKIYVQAVGKSMIQNHLSAPVLVP